MTSLNGHREVVEGRRVEFILGYKLPLTTILCNYGDDGTHIKEQGLISKYKLKWEVDLL